MTKFNDELFDSIEAQLDKLAQEIYGEFGYDTLTPEQAKEVRKIVINKLYK